MTIKVAWVTALSMKRVHFGVVLAGEAWPYAPNGEMMVRPEHHESSWVVYDRASLNQLLRDQGAEEVMYATPYTGSYRRTTAEKFLSRKSVPRKRPKKADFLAPGWTEDETGTWWSRSRGDAVASA